MRESRRWCKCAGTARSRHLIGNYSCQLCHFHQRNNVVLTLFTFIGIMLWELSVDSLVVVVGAFLGQGVVGSMVGLGDGSCDQPAGV